MEKATAGVSAPSVVNTNEERKVMHNQFDKMSRGLARMPSGARQSGRTMFSGSLGSLFRL
jgi:hypothetical protein